MNNRPNKSTCLLLWQTGFAALIALVCFACGGQSPTAVSGAGDTLQLKYAERITIVKHKDYTEVKLADPWATGKTLHTYLLVSSERPLPAQLPEGSVVRIPLKRCVVATSVHCALVDELGKAETISGVCEPQYIHLPFVTAGCKAGRIIDCGSGMAPTVEKIIDLQPDAMFLSPFQNSGGYGRIDELQIPIIETADYMETSALGRAEWVKFYGLLFGVEQRADSLFDAVEKNYLALKEQAQRQQKATSKKVIIDKLTGSVWYVPAGESTLGKMLTDAGITYPWAADTHSGSLALPFERVFESAGDADIWLFRYNSPTAISYAALQTEHEGYTQIKAFRTRNAYGCNTRTSSFYEETPFHPDRLLRDFITISHPALQLGAPRYFIKLEK